MSEKPSRSTPFSEALNQFEDNKTASEEERYFDELQADAGKTDFSDDARQRLEDLQAYDRYLESFSNDNRSAYDRGLDQLESGERESAALTLASQEHEDALAMNEAFDEKKTAEAEELKRAQDEALKEKLQDKNNPRLKHMNMISIEIAKLRGEKLSANPKANETNKRRLGDLEDRLQHLLTTWSEEDDYDPALADMLIDRDDTKAYDQAAANSLKEKMETIHDDPELQAAVDIKKFIDENPEAAEASGATKARDELLREIAAIQSGTTDEARKDVETALSEAAANPAGAKIDEKDFVLPPHEEGDVHVAGRSKAEAPVDDEAAALEKAAANPAGADVDEKDFELPGDDSKKEADDNGAKEKLTDEEREKLDDELEKNGKKGRLSWAKRALKRAGDIYAHAGAAYANKRFSAMERFEVYGKKKTVAAIGAIALVPVAFATLKLTGAFDHDHDGSGGGSGANGGWNHADGNDHSPMPKPEDFPSAAYDVDPGEGWFKTMADAGITDPEKQQAILANDEVMGKLQKMGLAYEAPELGGWGISMPENGKMPSEALELLTNAAK